MTEEKATQILRQLFSDNKISKEQFKTKTLYKKFDTIVIDKTKETIAKALHKAIKYNYNDKSINFIGLENISANRFLITSDKDHRDRLIKTMFNQRRAQIGLIEYNEEIFEGNKYYIVWD